MRTSLLKAVVLLLATSLITISTPAQQPIAQQRTVRNLPRGLTELSVKRHIIAPPHIKNIHIEVVDESREVRVHVPARVTTFKVRPSLDLGAFGLAIHTVLKDRATGYLLQVRKNGNLVFAGGWNWAQTPADQSKAWTENTRMHVASVSKFLTAVALVKALDSKRISYDAKIIDFLPDYWSKGNNINRITFRHLLTHRSGFDSGEGDDKYRTDYAFMKRKVAEGVSNVGSASGYENMNFGLIRILIPLINGNIGKGTQFTGETNSNDQAWDAVTIFHYRNYVQAKVFTPVRVRNVGFEPLPGGRNALAYRSPHNNISGWNSGNLDTVAGGAGWRLSTKELLNVMNHVRRKNTIISATKAQFMLDNKFGIDQSFNTPAGKIYNKNGAWGTCDNNGNCKIEQCVAYFLPNGMEVVVFVNSPIGTSGFSLRDLVKDSFLASLSD